MKSSTTVTVKEDPKIIWQHAEQGIRMRLLAYIFTSVGVMALVCLIWLLFGCATKYTIYKPLYPDWESRYKNQRCIIVDSNQYFYEVIVKPK